MAIPVPSKSLAHDIPPPPLRSVITEELDSSQLRVRHNAAIPINERPIPNRISAGSEVLRRRKGIRRISFLDCTLAPAARENWHGETALAACRSDHLDFYTVCPCFRLLPRAGALGGAQRECLARRAGSRIDPAIWACADHSSRYLQGIVGLFLLDGRVWILGHDSRIKLSKVVGES